MSNFVHLHNHSEYSLLDGFSRLKQIAQKAKDCGMEHAALTDHGVMYGCIEFYKICKGLGINPILGCETYVAQRTRFDKDPKLDKERYHLVLLAENNEGYKNLCQMISLASTEGQYYKPRVDKELLRKYHKGIICLSACLAGEVPRALQEDNYEKAKVIAAEYLDIFGEGNYFLEIQNQGIAIQPEINRQIAKIGEELNIPLVATNDCHYISQEDAQYHDILLCMQTERTINDPNRLRYETDQFYFKTFEEMQVALPDYPEALANTVKIAERCNVEIDLSTYFLPVYDVPEGYTIETYLEKLCEDGIKERYSEITQEVRERLDYELGVIKQMGFPGYFLIVWDMINFAKQNGIAVGPGRGSAAGSIVAYAIGITDIDPLKYNLIFERFLNPSRISMPDIDTDFCYERRSEVFQYLSDKYGHDHVAQIITFGTMKARLAVRDAARVLEIPYGEADKIAKLIPEELGATIDMALKVNPDLKHQYDTNTKIKQLIDIAKKVEGLPRHSGLHACGLVIAPDVVSHFCPVQQTDDGGLATQYQKEVVEEIGLLKMDLLGLRTLTVISDACDNIKHSQGIDIDISSIPLDDKKTYEMLAKGEGNSVFQLESSGMQTVMKNLIPETIEEITALVALYRPGPIEGGMIDEFVDRKHGRKEIVYDHPVLEPILKETYGVILYQEQVMQIASAMAGFSMAEADYLRKAMGKKKPEILAKFKSQFVEGSVNNNVDREVAEKIFDMMEKFAGYGFNKSHSVAYAVVAYRTAWLKANYPKEYLAAILTSVMDKTDKVTGYINECRRLNIDVLPPDINESRKNFTVVGNNIRFGLAAVKNVGIAPCNSIIAEREENGPFTSLLNFCKRLNLNSRVLESLISSGAFDSFGMHRAQLIAAVPKCQAIAESYKKDRSAGQMSLFDFGFGDNGNGDNIEEDFSEFDNIKPFNKIELLKMEKAMLGIFVTGHILDSYRTYWQDYALTKTSDLENKRDGEEIFTAGLISHTKFKTNKNNQLFAQFDLEDLDGSVHCFVFSRDLEVNRAYIAEDNIVAIQATIRKNDDDVTINIRHMTDIENITRLEVPSTHGMLNIRRNEDIDIYEDNDNALPSPEPVNEIPPAPVEYYYTDLLQQQTPPPKPKVSAQRLYVNISKGDAGKKEEFEIKKVLARDPGPHIVYSYYKDKGTVKPFGLTVSMSDDTIGKIKRIVGDSNVFLKVVES